MLEMMMWKCLRLDAMEIAQQRGVATKLNEESDYGKI
jgi:hypothetical protein